MKGTRGLEAVLVRALLGGAAALPWAAALAAGARLGDLARGLGLRRRVAAENLARAFPEMPEPARARLLRSHYRELGRVALEYARLPELARAAPGRVISCFAGREHLERAIRGGRGAVMMSGHYGNFELMGATAAQRYPLSFVVRPLANPGVEAMIHRRRERAGVGQIPTGAPVRRIFEALHANTLVAMLADQDARRHGVFVPFFGRPASTPIGPARIALATGAPLIMGFIWREEDGRHRIEIGPPLEIEEPRAPDAALRLTALHVRRLEERIRQAPEHWFWLHRRWKTAPPADPVPADGKDG